MGQLATITQPFCATQHARLRPRFASPLRQRMLRRMTQRVGDRDLMVRYGKGEADAFDLLYGRHKGPLYRYLMRQCGRDDVAADLFQETWSRVIQARHRYAPTAKFTTWLYRIARNCAIDWARKQRVSLSLDDVPEPAAEREPTPEQAAITGESLHRFRHALTELSFEQREAFLLREEGDFGVGDIAAITGVGRETAKSRLRYAARKLRGALAEDAETLDE